MRCIPLDHFFSVSLAPQLLSRVGIAFGLMAVAVGLTWVAARLTRAQAPG